MHFADVKSPPPPPVCMSIGLEGKLITHAQISVRVLVLNDPPAPAGERGYREQALDHEPSPRVCTSNYPEFML